MNEGNTEQRKQIISKYRAAQILHTWGTVIFRNMLSDWLLTGEALMILGFFIAIRMNTRLGLISLFALIFAGVTFYCFKVTIEFAADLTDRSQEFCKSKTSGPLSKEIQYSLSSCQPLKTPIGGTITISKETFPNVSQQVILDNLINLLVGY